MFCFVINKIEKEKIIMAKVPAVKPFNITEYARRNKFSVSNPICMSDESKVYFLSKANSLQCLNINKDGQIIGAKCAGGSTRNLVDTMVSIITKLKNS